MVIATIPDWRPTTCSTALRYSRASPPCATITIPITTGSLLRWRGHGHAGAAPLQFAMPYRHLPAVLRKGGGEGFCHRHAAMLPAGAAETDREIGLALGLVGGQQLLDQRGHLGTKALEARIGAHKIRHLGRTTVKAAQRRLPIWVVEKP